MQSVQGACLYSFLWEDLNLLWDLSDVSYSSINTCQNVCTDRWFSLVELLASLEFYTDFFFFWRPHWFKYSKLSSLMLFYLEMPLHNLLLLFSFFPWDQLTITQPGDITGKYFCTLKWMYFLSFVCPFSYNFKIHLKLEIISPY